MKKISEKRKFIIFNLIAVFLFMSTCSEGRQQEESTRISDREKRYNVVQPGTHPSLLFSEHELEELRLKAHGNGLPRKMWKKIKRLADDWTVDGEWIKRGMEINAKAQITKCGHCIKA